jgi:hypothetical protein
MCSRVDGTHQDARDRDTTQTCTNQKRNTISHYCNEEQFKKKKKKKKYQQQSQDIDMSQHCSAFETVIIFRVFCPFRYHSIAFKK